ncbi:phenylalanine--tRNA ligase subunit beta [Erysipelothrix urinaevulpis]|uniref:phenylalanine--tRNA ligase subunit beta n=1 Tax=Erysipelothrix urinaevulpis TaxID=2683717 RepID=UPI0013575E36|nr:phenylalanine--tRNA ligase subunit beta [Erysipelothrix urinaevulpis]
MLVSRKLLNRYVDLKDISTNDLADTLTNAGLEVEGIDVLLDVNHLVVGFVKTCVAHEDSDHLHVCEVDVGDQALQIVCGAKNIAQGQKVIVAKVGAQLPGDFEIKDSVIRGVASSGMICSLGELGISEKTHPNGREGIYVFEDEAVVGMNAVEALGMDDEVMDIKQTPNRSDFMALSSIAKEVAALYKTETTLPNFEMPSVNEAKSQLKLSLDTKLAQQFLGRVVNKVEIKESPQWIKEALIASGMRPINNLVDISNIVMLETGQPIHFYAKDFLSPLELSVVTNYEGDVVGLDGNTYQITTKDQMIMNGATPVGIAGIMGLENSMIQDTTQAIVIEVATFDRVAVRQTSTRLGISSEASQRFSKPMDPLAPIMAMNRAVELLIEYGNAEDFEELVKVGNIENQTHTIETTTKKVNDLLGTDFSDDEIMDVFERLNLNPVIVDSRIQTSIPSYRLDLRIPEDLSEEVIRVLGYDRLPETLPKMDLTHGSYTVEQKILRDLESILLSYGANQVVTYTLDNKENTNNPLSIGHPIKLLSPLSESRAYLRTSLLPALVDTMTYNKARKNDHLFMFETSRLYSQDGRETHLAMIGEGFVNKETWLKDSIKIDFYLFKGIFLEMMTMLGYQERRFTFEPINQSEIFNPYKTASVKFDRKEIGVIGHLHPKYANKHDLGDSAYMEINLDPILEAKRGAVKSSKLPKHHDIVRDIAILVNKDILAEDLMNTMNRASKRSVKELSVFDVFESNELGNKKSIAFELRFDGEKIRSSKDIQTIMDAIEEELSKKHEAIIR